jgi:hypothetical protein
MTTLQLKLMRREGMGRLQDADLLSGLSDVEETSNSDYLLRLLALELLLKCLCLASGCDAKKVHGHNYGTLFKMLPEPTKDELLRLAIERLGPSGLTINLEQVFADLSANFIDLRYPYEKYKGLDERRYIELGDEWIAAGARLETATFRFHSEELYGLNHALAAMTLPFAWE